MKNVWFIGGSDPSAGAGIQADLKVASHLGVAAQTIVTSLTIQNGLEFHQETPVPPADLVAQWRALEKEYPPTVIKIGLLSGVDQIRTLAGLLSETEAFVILDPVLRSTSGKLFHASPSLHALREELFPWVDLLTPNLTEASAILGRTIAQNRQMPRAAVALSELGPRTVLLKGGHLSGADCTDYLLEGTEGRWLHQARLPVGTTHGTGCTFASAIAAFLARGENLHDATVAAKAFVHRGLRMGSLSPGGLHLLHLAWPVEPRDWPGDCLNPDPFPLEDQLRFYPIVPGLTWLRRVVKAGAKTVQLRLKGLPLAETSQVIAEAVAFARKAEVRLYINDEWKLAIRHGAYGVHLGQQDLEGADLGRIQRAGLRLGLSTHCYSELARALACQPSYVALGPIFPTTAKPMPFGPQGITRLREWKSLSQIPLVAIGGITLDRAAEIYAAGADGISVISDITQAKHPEKRLANWLATFRNEAEENPGPRRPVRRTSDAPILPQWPKQI